MVEHGVLAIEMEASRALHARRRLRPPRAGICTVSDHIVTGEETTSQEREQTFGDMVEIALRRRHSAWTNSRTGGVHPTWTSSTRW